MGDLVTTRRPLSRNALGALSFLFGAGALACGGGDSEAICAATSDCSLSFSCIDGACVPLERRTDAGVAGDGSAVPDAGRGRDPMPGGDAGSADSGSVDSGSVDSGSVDSGSAIPPPLSYEVLSEIRVTADGPGGRSAYQLFWAGFGDGSVEAPDLYDNNHPADRHVREIAGGPSGNFFRFTIHRDVDRDRDRYPSIDDRQRNEVKTFARSPEAGKGRQDDTVRYQWYFRIPESYATTGRFNHVMQVKAAGGNDRLPVLTLTAAERRGESRLQIRYASETGELDYLATTALSNVVGEWLEGEVVVTNATSGYLRVMVRAVDGPLVLFAEESDIVTYRTGSEFIRPKWGIYRSLAEVDYLANETDTLDLAQFTVQKIRLR